MKNINSINLKYKGLKINQDKDGNRLEMCYSEDGNCRECRCARECDWFLSINGFEYNL